MIDPNCAGKTCTICGTPNGLSYCGPCRKCLCPTCKHRWGARAVAATQAAGQSLVDHIRGILGR